MKITVVIDGKEYAAQDVKVGLPGSDLSVREKLAATLKERFAGRDVTSALVAEVTASLLDMAGSLGIEGELTAEADPDNAGAVKVSATGDYARWLKAAEDASNEQNA